MKLQVTHLDAGVRAEEITENCCGTMSEVIANGTVANNNDFVEAFSNDFEPFNIFRHDANGSVAGFYPLRFCPFCGQQIVIEFIDGRAAPQD